MSPNRWTGMPESLLEPKLPASVEEAAARRTSAHAEFWEQNPGLESVYEDGSEGPGIHFRAVPEETLDRDLRLLGVSPDEVAAFVEAHRRDDSPGTLEVNRYGGPAEAKRVLILGKVNGHITDIERRPR